MEKQSKLTIECSNPAYQEKGLQVGFTVDEMTDRVEKLLRSIGLVSDFAPIVYVIGHGSSSVNNPHYAAYDCGACSGRPGSVNARVFCYMANHPEVRAKLNDRGISIPDNTIFIGGLHDTTRDEIQFLMRKRFGCNIVNYITIIPEFLIRPYLSMPKSVHEDLYWLIRVSHPKKYISM